MTYSTKTGTAQLSLSEILLVLNTGLIKVICAATSDNLQDRQLSRRLLLELSEATGKDAVKALRQLRERLSGHDNTTIPLTIKPADASAQGQVNQRATNSDGTRNSACRKKPVGAPRRTQRPKPCRSATVRIAWVRPLKGKVSASQAKVANSRSNHSFPNSETKGTVPEIISQPKPSAKRTNSAISAVSELRRMPYEETGKESAHSQASMMTLDQTTSKRGLVQKEVHEGQRSARSPPVPPKIPLNSQCESPPVPPKDPIVKISRRPVSTYSFMSDSTKVGEIPEHKLPAWAPPPEDPYAGLVSAQQLKRQKRHSLMFWRK